LSETLIAQSRDNHRLFHIENSKGSLSNCQITLDRAKVNLAYATIYSPNDGVGSRTGRSKRANIGSKFQYTEMFTLPTPYADGGLTTSVMRLILRQVKRTEIEFLWMLISRTEV
jgi:hypothetical protein